MLSEESLQLLPEYNQRIKVYINPSGHGVYNISHALGFEVNDVSK